MKKQQTIKNLCEISGKGLHTGKEVRLRFLPANPNQGIVFKRTDIYKDNIIPALVDFVTDTSRGTTISNGNATVKTIEHMMAAISGLEINNLTIEIDSEETPIIDGSSLQYVKLLKGVGIEEQNETIEYFNFEEEVHYEDKEKDVQMTLKPSDNFKITCIIDYKSNIIPPQEVCMESIEDFEKEFSSARTFAFLHEIEPMLKHGLIKGGDLKNAIVFIDHIISEEEQKRLSEYFNMPNIKVTKEGVLNNVTLHFENEPARHKLLDILGDISLVGVPFNGHIIARRPGHKTNTEFAKILKNIINQKKHVSSKSTTLQS